MEPHTKNEEKEEGTSHHLCILTSLSTMKPRRRPVTVPPMCATTLQPESMSWQLRQAAQPKSKTQKQTIDVIFNTLVNFPPTANGGWFFRNLSDARSRLSPKRESPCHEDGNVFVPVHHTGGETGCYQAVEACRRISTCLFVGFYRHEHFRTIRMLVLILPPLAPRSEPQSKQKKDREPASTWMGGG